ncbi:MAG: cytochrome c biogenesis protein ResB [Gammaproteobacteria bacterium]|nr:cytochrome c biogenesis protein ResB [Gammaproteobacteria bacterium]
MIRAIKLFASLRLVLLGMGLLAAGVLVNINIHQHVFYIVVPLTLLAVNLAAALLTNRLLRQNPGLSIFHISLLVLLVLIAYGRMTYFKGRVEITQGQDLPSAVVTTTARGPWHKLPFTRVNFEQGPIAVDYAAGLMRRDTRSTVKIIGASGKGDSQIIGDDEPLRLDNYRFYTTSNKGFAALVEWTGVSGDSVLGAIHFPSYPALEWKQYAEWTTPAGQPLKLELKLPKVPEKKDWTLSNKYGLALVIVSDDNRSVQLQSGDELIVDNGTVRLIDVRLWMGYRVFYDPTLSLLFIVAVTGVLGLTWHIRKKLWVATTAMSGTTDGVMTQHG